MADKSEKTVTLTHPESDQQLQVPESEADKYTHGGWAPAEESKSTK